MTSTSYPVLSAHYNGPPSVRFRAKVNPSEIKSIISNLGTTQFGLKDKAPTVSSYGWGPNFYYKDKGDFVSVTSSGNVYRTMNPQFGLPNQLDDYGMKEFKQNGEANPPGNNSYIPETPNVMHLQGIARLGLFTPVNTDTQVDLKTTPQLIAAVHGNRLGHYMSKTAELEMVIRRMSRGSGHYEEASDYVRFLAKKGEIKDPSGIIVLGTETGNLSAGYYPNQGFFVRAQNFRDKARRAIEKYGENSPEAVEAMERAIVLHEMTHTLGVGGGAGNEMKQGMLQHEFYSERSKQFKGTKWERIYKAIAEEGLDYARYYASLGILSPQPGDRLHSQLEESLMIKFELEGKELGYKGESLQEYVNSRFHDTYKPFLEGKPSHKSGKNSKSLERLVEDSKEAKGKNQNSKNSRSSYDSRKDYKEDKENKYDAKSKDAAKQDEPSDKEPEAKESEPGEPAES